MKGDAAMDLSEPYPLAEEQRDDFRSNGHVLLRGVASADEIAFYRSEILETSRTLNSERRPLAGRDTYGKAFLQTTNLWQRNSWCKRFVFSQRFARIAATLLGVERVRLYHDQSLFKEAGGGPTPWHQDQYYWPLDTANTVTMWMPLVPVTPDMGPMVFASGSHKKRSIASKAISDDSESFFSAYILAHGLHITSPPTMQPGDATFHYGWTLHAAGGNTSSTDREVMTIIYFADGARVTIPQHEHQEADWKVWLNALPPGSPADSPTTPLLLL